MLGVFVQFCVSDGAEHNDYLLVHLLPEILNWNIKVVLNVSRLWMILRSFKYAEQVILFQFRNTGVKLGIH